MNAQEALDELKRAKETLYPLVTRYDNTGLSDEVAIILKDVIPIFQQLIDQANAKPKTLEELGWKLVKNDEYLEKYTKEYALLFEHIDIYKKSKAFAIYSTKPNDIQSYYNLSYEEILAIAEKMKELGMT